LWEVRDASERMVSYYSYLFTFPSRGVMIAAIATISTCGCALAFTLAWGAASAVRGILYGILGLTAPLLVSDALSAPLFRDDVFLTPRRFTIISYASSIVYVGVILLTSLSLALTGRSDLLARGVMLGVAINIFMRQLSIQVLSSQGLGRNIVATFIQPVFCFAAGVVLLTPGLRILVLGSIGAVIMVGGVQLLLWVMGRWEGAHRGLRLMPLFRAFILAWTEELNEPLEEQITRVGEARDLCVDSLIYGNASGGCMAALITPYIHPGPFRNVGSSALPNVLTARIGEKLGCEVLVPHGVSTHEQDLTRSDEAERVAEDVAANLCVGGGFDLASPFIIVETHGAQASCQMFGDVALITLTLSPKSYDDLPEELGERIMEAALAMGVTAVVVDSHNSILHRNELNDSDVDDLFQAAVEAIRSAKKAPRYTFSVGAARVIPGEWGLDDGMGPGGVAALAIRLKNRQTAIYIIVDGNNMTSGLRERIIDALKSSGIDEAEVLTSDTHLVNAIGATTRGYYPIGERIDDEGLIGYVVEATEAAVSRLGKCRASHTRTVVPGLTVLGAGGLELLGDVLESAFSLFKRTALAVTPASLLLAAAVVFLL